MPPTASSTRMVTRWRYASPSLRPRSASRLKQQAVRSAGEPKLSATQAQLRALAGSSPVSGHTNLAQRSRRAGPAPSLVRIVSTKGRKAAGAVPSKCVAARSRAVPGYSPSWPTIRSQFPAWRSRPWRGWRRSGRLTPLLPTALASSMERRAVGHRCVELPSPPKPAGRRRPAGHHASSRLARARRRATPRSSRHSAPAVGRRSVCTRFHRA